MTFDYVKFNKKTDKEVDTVIAALRNNIKNLDIFLGFDGEIKPAPALSTGSIKLDHALGIGGYAVGKIVELYGPEMSGKTTLTLHAIANCQKAGGRAAFIDAEHALDLHYAQGLGVNLDELILHQPDHAEQALDVVDSLATSGVANLIVVDSIAGLVPKDELGGEAGDFAIGLMARLMGQSLRKLTGTCRSNGVTIIWTNQIRHKIGVFFGSPETTPGGNALKFFATQRLDIRRTGKVTSGDTIVGNKTKVTVVKNKVAPPYAVAEFEISYGKGVDIYKEVLDLAVERKIIKQSGSWYSVGNERLGQGAANIAQRLQEDSDLFNSIKRQLTGESSPEKAEVPDNGQATSISSTMQGEGKAVQG